MYPTQKPRIHRTRRSIWLNGLVHRHNRVRQTTTTVKRMKKPLTQRLPLFPMVEEVHMVYGRASETVFPEQTTMMQDKMGRSQFASKPSAVPSLAICCPLSSLVTNTPRMNKGQEKLTEHT